MKPALTHTSSRFKTFISIISFVFLGFVISAQDVTIGIFGSNTNINSNFIAGVTTFTPSAGGAMLDVVALNDALALGDVKIMTSTGSVIFAPGTFEPTTANRNLLLEASVDISVSFVYLLIVNNLINIDAQAQGDFFINGHGVNTFGGSLNVDAKNISIGNGGLNTGGGNVTLNAENDIIINGVGVNTMGGDFMAESGDDINIGATGLVTSGGIVNLFAANLVQHTGAEIKTSSGKFYAKSADFTTFGVTSSTGNLEIEVTNMLTVQGPGLRTSDANVTVSCYSAQFSGGNINTFYNGASLGGDIRIIAKADISFSGYHPYGKSFYSEGVNITSIGGGIHTKGGPVHINHTGIVEINGGGIQTEGGEVKSTGSDFTYYGTGILSRGGNIHLCHTGNIGIINGGFVAETGTVNVHTTGGDVDIRDGGIRTMDRNVEVLAPNGSITVDNGNINTGCGSVPCPNTGMLTTNLGGGAITIIIGPDLGGGNVLLDTLNNPDCTLFRAIPTLSQWGLFLLLLLLINIGTIVFLKIEKSSNVDTLLRT